MNDEIAVVKDVNLPAPIDDRSLYDVQDRQNPAQNGLVSNMIDEAFETIKSDRANIKRAISANAASTAMVQKQNDKCISVWMRELEKEGNSEEYNAMLVNRISESRRDTYNANIASIEFQREQLRYSHELVWKTVGISAFLIAEVFLLCKVGAKLGR